MSGADFGTSCAFYGDELRRPLDLVGFKWETLQLPLEVLVKMVRNALKMRGAQRKQLEDVVKDVTTWKGSTDNQKASVLWRAASTSIPWNILAQRLEVKASVIKSFAHRFMSGSEIKLNNAKNSHLEQWTEEEVWARVAEVRARELAQA